MCTRLGCPFQDHRRPPDDGFIRILIIGATGMTGTAVLSAAIACIWFKITIFTRSITGEVMEEILKKPISKVVEGDMFNYESVLDAMKGIDAVFFSTTYWDTMRVDCEFDQGQNVVKAAMTAGVKHLLYVGTPYCSLLTHDTCKYLLGKEKVEAHIVSSGVPYTILHLGFYYENFLSVFKPHMVDKDRYALALPMGNIPLNCGSVLDFGQCIGKMMLRPALNVYKTIKLATGYHTVAELAKVLDDHFPNLTFYDPKIPLSAYRSFDFKGAPELASMFAYYQTITRPWSQDVAFSYYSNCRSFKDWVAEEEALLLEVVLETLEPPVDAPRPEGFRAFPVTKLLGRHVDHPILRRVVNLLPHSRFTGRWTKETDVDEKRTSMAVYSSEYKTNQLRQSAHRAQTLQLKKPLDAGPSTSKTQMLWNSMTNLKQTFQSKLPRASGPESARMAVSDTWIPLPNQDTDLEAGAA